MSSHGYSINRLEHRCTPASLKRAKQTLVRLRRGPRWTSIERGGAWPALPRCQPGPAASHCTSSAPGACYCSRSRSCCVRRWSWASFNFWPCCCCSCFWSPGVCDSAHANRELWAPRHCSSRHPLGGDIRSILLQEQHWESHGNSYVAPFLDAIGVSSSTGRHPSRIRDPALELPGFRRANRFLYSGADLSTSSASQGPRAIGPDVKREHLLDAGSGGPYGSCLQLRAARLLSLPC